MKITRAFDFLYNQLEKYPQEDCLVRKENGKWIKQSTEEVIRKVNALTQGFIDLGLKKGDKIALVTWNRPEFNLVDFAAQQLGVVTVPLYPTLMANTYEYIVKNADVKYGFVADQELYDKLVEGTKNLEGQLLDIYSFDKLEGIKNLEELYSDTPDMELIEKHKNEVLPEDLLTLIYTSGTTGDPKGVMLSHSNLVSNVICTKAGIDIDENDKALSFLPLSHVLERMVGYLYVYAGLSIYYAESIDTIGENMKEVNPQVFVTVPRLLEKVYEKIVAKGSALTGIKKAMFFWALELGQKYDAKKDQGFWYDFQLKWANKLIFSKWREALGGSVKLVVTGSAALQPRLARVFSAAQIPAMEGYGLTETSPVIAVNQLNPDNNLTGTVGPIIEGIEVKISEKGEILTRGPHVMTGYYNMPEATAETIDADGWLHTGDKGEFVEGKFLKITGRIKEIFKTSGGKYISPVALENKFSESKIIEQILVIGENRKFPAALIVPAFDKLKEWCEIKDIPYSSDEQMMLDERVIKKFDKECETYNAIFANYERLKKVELVLKPWTIESGELTPTMKPKRRIVLANNAELIEKMYDC